MNDKNLFIMEDDWAWWNNRVDDKWKKLFTAHIYHGDSINYDDPKTYEFDHLQKIGQTILKNPADLEKILNLTNLRVLDIDSCGISDITVIGNFTKLETLYLGYNGVSDSDLKILCNLKNLKKLSLNNSPIYETTVVVKFFDTKIKRFLLKIVALFQRGLNNHYAYVDEHFDNTPKYNQ